MNTSLGKLIVFNAFLPITWILNLDLYGTLSHAYLISVKDGSKLREINLTINHHLLLLVS